MRKVDRNKMTVYIERFKRFFNFIPVFSICLCFSFIITIIYQTMAFSAISCKIKAPKCPKGNPIIYDTCNSVIIGSKNENVIYSNAQFTVEAQGPGDKTVVIFVNGVPQSNLNDTDPIQSHMRKRSIHFHEGETEKIVYMDTRAASQNSDGEFSISCIAFDISASGLQNSISYSKDKSRWLRDIKVVPGDEESNNVYVHYNIDNDNMNATSGGESIADKDEITAKVANEDDLATATITFSSIPESGKFVLRRSNDSLKLYTDPEKDPSKEVKFDSSNSKIFNLPKDTGELTALSSAFLYVEGYKSGESQLTLEYLHDYTDPDNKQTTEQTFGSNYIGYSFVAATLGNEPRPDQIAVLTITPSPDCSGICFPRLVGAEWSVTNPSDGSYNCIANSVGLSNVWIADTMLGCLSFPCISMDSYKPFDHPDPTQTWNNNGQFDYPNDVNHFYVDVYKCKEAKGPDDADIIFYSGFHAARKVTDANADKWLMFESKLGGNIRIEHEYSQIEDSIYGTPVLYYKNCAASFPYP